MAMRTLSEMLSNDKVSPDSLGSYELVQTLETFDWDAASGKYVNMVADKDVKIQHSFYSEDFGVDMILPIKIAHLCPTYDIVGNLAYTQGPQRRDYNSAPAHYTLKKALIVKEDSVLRTPSGNIKLGGKRPLVSDRVCSYGSILDRNYSAKSLRVLLADEADRSAVSLVYIERYSNGKLTGSSLNLLSKGKLIPLDKDVNGDALSVMLMIDFFHSHNLRETTSDVLDRSKEALIDRVN